MSRRSYRRLTGWREVATIATGVELSSVGIKELKNKLTQYLRRTKNGEEVVVTERGKPIAIIQPIRSGARPKSLEARLAQLAAQGRLTLPTRKPARRVPKVAVAGPPVSRTILKERR